MAFGSIAKDRRLNFGILPVNLLDRSALSPLARLLWGVLDSFGETIFPSIPFIAVRMGLDPSSKGAVRRYLAELIKSGFLQVRPRGLGQSNLYILTMPDYCFIESPELLKLAPGWSQAGDIGGRGTKTAQNRQNWLDRQKDAKDARVPASTGGGIQPVPGGVPASTGGGIQPVPLSIEGKEPKGGALAPFATQGREALIKFPEHWQDWAAKYEAATDRRFEWSKSNIKAALEINEKLAGNIAELDLIQNKYLACKFWGPKGSPLNKLSENLGEYLPTKQELKAACKHKCTARTFYNNGQGRWQRDRCQACGSFNDVLTAPAPVENAAALDQARQNIAAAMKRGAGKAELDRLFAAINLVS